MALTFQSTVKVLKIPHRICLLRMLCLCVYSILLYGLEAWSLTDGRGHVQKIRSIRNVDLQENFEDFMDS